MLQGEALHFGPTGAGLCLPVDNKFLGELRARICVHFYQAGPFKMLFHVILALSLALPTPAAALQADRADHSEVVKPLPTSPAAVNAAEPGGHEALDAFSPELTLKLQILLDRAHFSPGQIDGHMGDSTRKAFAAFERFKGFTDEPTATAENWGRLLDLGKASGDASKAPSLVQTRALRDLGRSKRGGAQYGESAPANVGSAEQSALIQISIPEAGIKGPFVKKIPETMKAQAHVHRLSYRNADEKLGELYHSSPQLLHALNPGMKFSKAGQRIWVPNIHSEKPEGEVTKVVADKRSAEVMAFGQDNRLLAVYPATIGSSQKPTPDGETEIVKVTRNPWYTYDPRVVNFKEVKTKRILRIAPGPHNPVGLVWIALAKQGYGIHGAPEPAKVSKTSSHGCVRLTNWDALELSSLVRPGVPVAFERGPSKPARS